MIAEVILQNASLNPNKTAIFCDDLTVSYKQLAEIVAHKCRMIDKPGQYLIDSLSPLDAICGLIACQLKNSLGLVVQPLTSESDKRFFYEVEGFVPIGERGALTQRNFISKGNFLAMLTSGSTGTPKLIYKDNDCWEKAFIHQSNVFGISAEDNVLVVDALAYSANLNAVLHALWLGATVTMCSLSKASKWQHLITEKQVTSVFMVPSHLNLFASNISNIQIKSIVTAGEKLASSLAKKILESFPYAQLTEYYGTAELGHITYHQNNEITDSPLSVGKAFPEVEIKINGNKLYVKSPFVSPDFRGINTVGDLGFWENGELILIGRSGRIFNRRGLNIYAQEIEQKALLHPYVEEAVLLEKNRKGLKKLILVYSAKHVSFPVGDESIQLMKYLRAIIPPAKCPNRVVEVVSFPRLPNGKIDEKGLRKMLEYGDEEVKA